MRRQCEIDPSRLTEADNKDVNMVSGLSSVCIFSCTALSLSGQSSVLCGEDSQCNIFFCQILSAENVPSLSFAQGICHGKVSW